MVEDVSLITISDLSEISAEVICVTVLVEPPTPQQAWGEVIETNVEDNNLQDCIMIPHLNLRCLRTIPATSAMRTVPLLVLPSRSDSAIVEV
jgi:hypothetical protein